MPAPKLEITQQAYPETVTPRGVDGQVFAGRLAHQHAPNAHLLIAPHMPGGAAPWGNEYSRILRMAIAVHTQLMQMQAIRDIQSMQFLQMLAEVNRLRRRINESMERQARQDRRAGGQARSGRWRWVRGSVFNAPPVPGGTFISFWGDCRAGCSRRHQGVDIGAPKGHPCIAMYDGTVEYGEGGLAGKYYRLHHPRGGYAFGAHLDSFGKNGRVRLGDQIGTVGNTGNARYTPPHLHFEWRPKGYAINPLPFLQRVYDHYRRQGR